MTRLSYSLYCVLNFVAVATANASSVSAVIISSIHDVCLYTVIKAPTDGVYLQG